MSESLAWQFESQYTDEERIRYLFEYGKTLGDGWGGTVSFKYTPIERYERDSFRLTSECIDHGISKFAELHSSTCDLFGAGVLRDCHIVVTALIFDLEFKDDNGRMLT